MAQTLETHAHQDAHPRVVVGVDGSPGSIAALRAGAWAAAARGGTLVAVTSWGLPPIVPRAPIEIPDFRETAVEILKEALAEAFAVPALVPVRTVVSPGTAVGVLLEEGRDADLLVVGSRGHGGFAGMLLGSVSMACAARATCPVLIMHPEDDLPGSVRTRSGSRVVAGVGGASDSRSVLLFAEEAAEEMDAELLAVAAFETTSILGDFRARDQSAAAAAKRTLEAEIADAFDSRPPARLRVETWNSSPAAALIEESRGADLVVIGRATRNEFAGVLLGAVSLAVAEHAQAPVLVIPPGARVASRRRTADPLASTRS